MSHKTIMQIDTRILEETVRIALREDIGTGDVTTLSTVDPRAIGRAATVSKAYGIVAGLPVVEEVFRQVDPRVTISRSVNDGARVGPGETLCTIAGPAQSILTGERVALNFLQRLSGVATRTAKFVELTAGTRARIVDTRKTTPGLRVLEKYAVTVGGGRNHRMGLYDAVMIKDNHIVAAGGTKAAIERARLAVPHTMTITVECETLEQVDEALESGADVLLLDNMDNATRTEAVHRAAGRALTEASGGITEGTAAEIAGTGVDILSVGALTHSAPALDISLDMISVELPR
jgi:nicotinate-nucleotide pyrophosphorylase (carboxylating)